MLDLEPLKVFLEAVSRELIFDGVSLEIVGITSRSLRDLQSTFETLSLTGFDHSSSTILKNYVKQIEKEKSQTEER